MRTESTTSRRLPLLALLAALALSGSALADGMPFPPYMYEMYETDQIAYIDHDADTDTEELHILPVFRGDATDFAWVVPTPSVPVVAESNDQIFWQCAQLSAPVYRNRDSFWGCQDNYYDTIALPGNEDGVTIYSHDLVGIYDVLVLGASDAAALADSLTAWGYLHEDNVDAVLPVLEAYVTDGWSFTAMRISEEAFGGQEYWYGGVDPVKFTFASEEIVYPMRISAQGSAETCDVILYVVADHRMTFDDARTDYANRLTADELAAVRHQYSILGSMLDEGDFITKLSRTFTPAEMNEDLVLERASSDEEFKQVHYSGVPITLGLLMAIGVGLQSLKRRRRRD